MIYFLDSLKNKLKSKGHPVDIQKKKLPSTLNPHARKFTPCIISAANLEDVQLAEATIEIHTKEQRQKLWNIHSRCILIKPHQLLSQEHIPLKYLASANIKIGTLDLHLSTDPLDEHTIYQTIDTKEMKISPAYFIGDRKISDSDAKTTMTSLDPLTLQKMQFSDYQKE